MNYDESQAFRLHGQDGKRHEVWARSDADAIAKGRTWGYRHGGCTRVELLTLQPGDDREGCWDRASVRTIWEN